MPNICALFLLAALPLRFFSQSPTDPEYEAHPFGEKQQLEQVIETQFTLPKQLQNFKFEVEYTAFLNIDSLGNAVNIRLDGGYNNLLQNEVLRLFRFMKFKRTLNMPDEPRPYFLKFNLSSNAYSKYFKQKSRINFKNPLPADSSYIVYTKAERSPEYYINGEEGLKDYFLSEMEYPKLAIEKSIEGTVVLEFVVETNGYVTGITVKKGVNGNCTEEAVRLVKKTRWLPAVIDKKYVRYKMTYPITFSLRNTARENSSSGTIGQ